MNNAQTQTAMQDLMNFISVKGYTFASQEDFAAQLPTIMEEHLASIQRVVDAVSTPEGMDWFYNDTKKKMGL